MNTKPQVMVIDDDDVICQSFDRVLSNQYNVNTVSSGEEALNMIDNECLIHLYRPCEWSCPFV